MISIFSQLHGDTVLFASTRQWPLISLHAVGPGIELRCGPSDLQFGFLSSHCTAQSVQSRSLLASPERAGYVSALQPAPPAWLLAQGACADDALQQTER